MTFSPSGVFFGCVRRLFLFVWGFCRCVCFGILGGGLSVFWFFF